ALTVGCSLDTTPPLFEEAGLSEAEAARCSMLSIPTGSLEIDSLTGYAKCINRSGEYAGIEAFFEAMPNSLKRDAEALLNEHLWQDSRRRSLFLSWLFEQASEKRWDSGLIALLTIVQDSGKFSNL